MPLLTKPTQRAARRSLILLCLLPVLAACTSSQPTGLALATSLALPDTPQPAAAVAPATRPPGMPSPTAVPTQATEPTPRPTRTPRPARTPTPTPRPPASPTSTRAPIGEIQPIPEGMVYLGDEATGALGFDMRGGGAIGSLRLDGRELVDRDDFGRYIQLSLYDGAQTYSAKGDDPYGNWGWNPLQAGSKGSGASAGAKVLEYRAGDGVLYVKSLAKEWGHFGQDSDVVYETWAWQRDGYFEITTRATHVGDDAHALTAHEFPAAYFGTSLTRMTTYLGEEAFAAKPISTLDHVAREGESAGEFHTYRFDMASVPGWKDTITQIRLDPTDAEAPMKVDSIRILSALQI